MKKILTLVTLAALAAVLAACGSSEGATGSSGDRTLTVLAASSLTEVFDKLATTFEAQHKGVKVKLVYDSSATLAGMAEQGAPGDVLATADEVTMAEAHDKGGTSSEPEEFATNVIRVAVPADNPGGVTRFADLQKSSVKYVVCVPTAPCGALAATLLRVNGITHPPVSEEVDVKSVLAKVESGDADAGLVYRTDITAAGNKVTGIDVPQAEENPNKYFVAVTNNAKQRGLAKEWIALMQSDAGQRVFADAGFGGP